jgi:6-phosphogluconolactonase (cycloisomerase 2 family)
LPVDSIYRFYGDPFLHKNSDGILEILFEDFSFDENYGNISLMTLDKEFQKTDQKILLDTKSHLSYPFIFREKNKIYVFPESSRSGVLSCYEFNPETKSLSFCERSYQFTVA